MRLRASSNAHLQTLRLQRTCGTQAGKPGTDNDDLAGAGAGHRIRRADATVPSAVGHGAMIVVEGFASEEQAIIKSELSVLRFFHGHMSFLPRTSSSINY